MLIRVQSLEAAFTGCVWCAKIALVTEIAVWVGMFKRSAMGHAKMALQRQGLSRYVLLRQYVTHDILLYIAMDRLTYKN